MTPGFAGEGLAGAFLAASRSSRFLSASARRFAASMACARERERETERERERERDPLVNEPTSQRATDRITKPNLLVIHNMHATTLRMRIIARKKSECELTAEVRIEQLRRSVAILVLGFLQ